MHGYFPKENIGKEEFDETKGEMEEGKSSSFVEGLFEGVGGGRSVESGAADCDGGPEPRAVIVAAVFDACVFGQRHFLLLAKLLQLRLVHFFLSEIFVSAGKEGEDVNFITFFFFGF